MLALIINTSAAAATEGEVILNDWLMHKNIPDQAVSIYAELFTEEGFDSLKSLCLARSKNILQLDHFVVKVGHRLLIENGLNNDCYEITGIGTEIDPFFHYSNRVQQMFKLMLETFNKHISKNEFL